MKRFFSGFQHKRSLKIGLGSTLLCGSMLQQQNKPEIKPGNKFKEHLDAAKKSDKLFRIGMKVLPNTQEYKEHYYDRAINAELHPLVERFMNLTIDRIIERYCHLNPEVSTKELKKLLSYHPNHFAWVGSDLFVTTTMKGDRRLCVIETNSCPSGQKSMPNKDHAMEKLIGYQKLMKNTFKPRVEEYLSRPENKDLNDSKYKLAVIYDKNDVEAYGYAHAMSNVFGEDIIVAKYYNNDNNPPVKFDENGILWVRVLKDSANKTGWFANETGNVGLKNLKKKEAENSSKIGENDCEWIPIKAAFRYVTQNPWDRIPLITKTMIVNPIITCLAGGRNKNLASKAYDLLNRELQITEGLKNVRINLPDTINDVSFDDIPLWIKRFGGVAVVKSPYGNAGVDVHTICCKDELDEFMKGEHKGRGYGEKYIVQALIGNNTWSSLTPHGRLYHVGTMPDSRSKTYAADLRMMIHYDEKKKKWTPLCMYSRRAKDPLIKNLEKYYEKTGKTSWDMLGTNLSVKLEGENLWSTDVDRLLLMDTKDFNILGLGIDDMIQAFVQTVLSAIAIDKVCSHLIVTDDNNEPQFDMDCFDNLNYDQILHDDIIKANPKRRVYTADSD